jgi:hypothetical protein
MKQKDDSELITFFNNSFNDFSRVTKNLIIDTNDSIQYLDNFKKSDEYSKLQISKQNTINKSVECYEHMQHMNWSWVIPASVSSKADINEVFNNIHKKLTSITENIGFKNYFTALCWATLRLPMLQELLTGNEGIKIVTTKMIKPIQTPTHLLTSFQTWEKEWSKYTGQKSQPLTNILVILKNLQVEAESLYNAKHNLTNKLKSGINVLPKKQSYLEDPFYIKASKKITNILQNNDVYILPGQYSSSTEEDSSDENLPEVPLTHIAVPFPDVIDIPVVPTRSVPIVPEKEYKSIVETIALNDKQGSVWIEIMHAIHNLHQNLQTYSHQMNKDSSGFSRLNEQLMTVNKKIFEKTAAEFTDSDKGYFQIAQGYLNAINRLLVNIKQDQFETILSENSDFSVVQKNHEEALVSYQQNLDIENFATYSQRIYAENEQLLSIFQSLGKEVDNKIYALENMKVQWVEEKELIEQKITPWTHIKNSLDISNSINETTVLQKELQLFMNSDLSIESLKILKQVQAQWQNQINTNKATRFEKMLISHGSRLVNQSIAFKFNQALTNLDALFANTEAYTQMNYSLVKGESSVFEELNLIQKQADNHKNLVSVIANCQAALAQMQDLYGLHKFDDDSFALRLKLKEGAIGLRAQQLSSLGSKILDTIGTLYDQQRTKISTQTNPDNLTVENLQIINHAIRSQLKDDLLLQEAFDKYKLIDCTQKMQRFERACEAIHYRSNAVNLFGQKLTNAEAEKNSFIAELMQILQAYACSGKIKEVLAKIEEGKKEFPDVVFKSLLNKVAVDIIDEEEKRPMEVEDLVLPKANIVPVNLGDITIPLGNPPEFVLPPVIPIQDQAKNILQNLGMNENSSKKKRYAQYFLDLYAQIDKFLSEASHLNPDKKSSVELIHSGLINDVSIFVLQHKNDLPKEAELTRFNEKFNYRLHSEDDKLEVHTTSSLTRFFANLIINLIFICLPLAISRAATGRYSTFYNSTLREKNRDEIDTARNEMWENRASFLSN